jgi:hypothetical protein
MHELDRTEAILVGTHHRFTLAVHDYRHSGDQREVGPHMIRAVDVATVPRSVPIAADDQHIIDRQLGAIGYPRLAGRTRIPVSHGFLTHPGA